MSGALAKRFMLWLASNFLVCDLCVTSTCYIVHCACSCIFKKTIDAKRSRSFWLEEFSKRKKKYLLLYSIPKVLFNKKTKHLSTRMSQKKRIFLRSFAYNESMRWKEMPFTTFFSWFLIPPVSLVAVYATGKLNYLNNNDWMNK